MTDMILQTPPTTAEADPPFDLAQFITRFQLQTPEATPPSCYQRQAAVLVPIIRRHEPTLLLTRRAANLRTHAGQVAFPGGAADLEDRSLIATALREAYEEVAIPTSRVQVLGTLPSLDSVSGFQVTPVVGLLPPDITLTAQADEVAALFEMPLREAFALHRYHSLEIEREHRRHRVYLRSYQQQWVWGLTATIIRQLALQVAAP
ncbi:CoA pyrophosphatase [Lonsdalea britannica]|uniref:CoA pyrophosphatase n=1 Tax=Lonsdalea britannica TaxID=1082704 RepID=UPI0026F2F1F1|nr:CoA pyrophosphatase [Lonsdalea britannica]